MLSEEYRDYYVIDSHGLSTISHINTNNPKRIGLRPRFRVYVLAYLLGVVSILCAMLIYFSELIYEHERVVHELNIMNTKNGALRDSLDNKISEENALMLAGMYITSKDTKLPVHKDSIYEVARRAGAYFPEVIVAQAIIESQCGRSSLGTNANNLFGMKQVGGRGRVTTQTQGRSVNGFGTYHNWQMSVIDRVLWERSIFRKRPASRNQYIDKMSKIYSEEGATYASKIRNLITTL